MSPRKAAKKVAPQPEGVPEIPTPIPTESLSGPDVPEVRPLPSVLDQDGRPIKPHEVWPESDWRVMYKAMTVANGQYAIGLYLGCQRCGDQVQPTGQTGDGSWIWECRCLVRRWQRE